MEKTLHLTVEEQNADGVTLVGMRLDAFLAAETDMSRSAAVKLVESGRVLCNRKAAAKSLKMNIGDEVTVVLPEPVSCAALPENIPLDVVYEDGDLLVVNKPVGMVVHPAPGNETGTLVNALLYHCRGELSGSASLCVGGVIRPGIVHRIDKDTSGLLVVAKNDDAHAGLSAQLKGHHIDRIYAAVAVGNFRDEAGTVNAPIGRHPVKRQQMAVLPASDKTAREAVTHYTVLAHLGRYTYLRCQLETGRTHQIRVHMAHLGHPLLGDPLYGGDGTPFQAAHKSLFVGQCLHAGELTFTHPRTGEQMHFTAPMPDNMQRILQILTQEANA